MQKSSGGILLASIFGFNLGEPEEAAMDSLTLEGVRGCSLYILKEIIEPRAPNWIDEIIEHEIGQS